MRNIFRRHPLPEGLPVEFQDENGQVVISVPRDAISGLISAVFPLLMKHGQVNIILGISGGTIAKPSEDPITLTVGPYRATVPPVTEP